MFWFIPMIMSAVSNQMQQNNQRANSTMQNNIGRSNNSNAMRLPSANTKNGLFNRITNNNANSNTPTASSLYNYMTDNQQSDISPVSKEISTPSASSSPVANSIETMPSASSSVSNSSALSGGGGSSGGGGWMSMANSLMGLMASNKTQPVGFTPTMSQPNYVETSNSRNNNYRANMSNIGKHNMYDYLIR